MIKTFVISLVAAFTLVASVSAQGIADYIAGFPVMAGLEEQADSLVVFDKAEARIIAGSFTGDVSQSDAAAFYRESLSQLGWQYNDQGGRNGAIVFTRQRERLELAFDMVGGVLVMAVSLNPAA